MWNTYRLDWASEHGIDPGHAGIQKLHFLPVDHEGLTLDCSSGDTISSPIGDEHIMNHETIANKEEVRVIDGQLVNFGRHHRM